MSKVSQFFGRLNPFAALAQLQKDVTTIKENQVKNMAALDDKIAALQKAVENDTTVEQSAITLINGIPKMIQDAVAAALAQGATPEQLAAFDALAKTIGDNSTSLAAAVQANTGTTPPAGGGTGPA